MPSEKHPKAKSVESLRHAEYYDMQRTFDELYARSQAGEVFDNLMELILSKDNIMLAYRNIKSNSGSATPGTDRLRITDIGRLPADEVVARVRKIVRGGTNGYTPRSVRRKEIPKPNGKTRPLGIPCIWDRLIQQCIKQVMEPICEAKFSSNSYGFRPNRSVENAIAAIYRLMQRSGLYYVVEFDVKGFFDNVDHSKLIRQLWSMNGGTAMKNMNCVNTMPEIMPEITDEAIIEALFAQRPYEEKVINSAFLEIPAEYQRKLNIPNVEKMSAEFTELIANPPKVSYRDGHYFVFDGQHTIVTRRAMNGGQDLPIICKVYEGLTEEEEAMLFSRQTGVSTPLTAGAELRAALVGKDPESLAFVKATESTGLQLGLDSYRAPWKIICIRTAFKEYKAYGADLYKEALTMLAKGWEGDPDSLRSGILQGMVRFVALYQGEYDPERLVKRLHTVHPMTLVNDEKSLSGTVSYKYMMLILRTYNGASRRFNLPIKQ